MRWCGSKRLVQLTAGPFSQSAASVTASARAANRASPRHGASVMQDHTQQRAVYAEGAVVFDEPESSEFVHEKIHARTRGADHFSQDFLGQFRQHALRLV